MSRRRRRPPREARCGGPEYSRMADDVDHDRDLDLALLASASMRSIPAVVVVHEHDPSALWFGCDARPIGDVRDDVAASLTPTRSATSPMPSAPGCPRSRARSRGPGRWHDVVNRADLSHLLVGPSLDRRSASFGRRAALPCGRFRSASRHHDLFPSAERTIPRPSPARAAPRGPARR